MHHIQGSKHQQCWNTVVFAWVLIITIIFLPPKMPLKWFCGPNGATCQCDICRVDTGGWDLDTCEADVLLLDQEAKICGYFRLFGLFGLFRLTWVVTSLPADCLPKSLAANSAGSRSPSIRSYRKEEETAWGFIAALCFMRGTFIQRDASPRSFIQTRFIHITVFTHWL